MPTTTQAPFEDDDPRWSDGQEEWFYEFEPADEETIAEWLTDQESDGTIRGVRGAEPPEISSKKNPPTQGASREGRRRGVGSEGATPSAGDEILMSFGAPLVPRRRRGRRTVRKEDRLGRRRLDGRQRLLLLDSWLRSKLPAKDFAGLVGVSQHTLYAWKQRFEREGPAGLLDRPKGGARAKGKSRLPEETKRAIVMLKDVHPDWGQDRIHEVLRRTEGYSVSPGAIGRVLLESGWEVEESATRRHPDKPRRFERARPNELWQTDLFTFVLKREGRRVHLVGYLDDHSRFIVGWGLHASSSGAMVREVLEAAIARFGAPMEILTDNGSQYTTWRGKSEFTKLLERRGIRQIVARPRRPQTLGKIERFWGTLWRECVQAAVFRGIDDARERIGHFVDHYNFQRTHSGIDGLVPADRYFAASGEVRRMLEARVKANALDLARHGEPRKPFYLTGRVGNAGISLHAEGERVVLVREDGTREEVDLTATGRRAEPVEPAEAEVARGEDDGDGEDGDSGEDSGDGAATGAEPDPPPPEQSPHAPDSEAEAPGGSSESAGHDSPVMADASPPDPSWTEDDGVEPPPGRSMLDGILANLARRWHKDGPPRPSAPERGGER